MAWLQHASKQICFFSQVGTLQAAGQGGKGGAIGGANGQSKRQFRYASPSSTDIVTRFCINQSVQLVFFQEPKPLPAKGAISRRWESCRTVLLALWCGSKLVHHSYHLGPKAQQLSTLRDVLLLQHDVAEVLRNTQKYNGNRWWGPCFRIFLSDVSEFHSAP